MMHLLTLLIAAVLSRSFVAPNAEIVTFTLTPATLNPDDFEDTPEFATNLATETYEAVTGYIALDVDAADGLDLAEFLDDTGTNWVIQEGIDLTEIPDPTSNQGLPESFWVFLREGEQAAPAKTQVFLEKPWALKTDDINEDSFDIENIEVTKPIPDWPVTGTAANDKVTLYVTDEEVDPEEMAEGDWIGKAESAAYNAGTKKYIITALDISTHSFAANEYAWVYVKYVKASGTGWDAEPIKIKVKATKKLYSITDPAAKTVAITATTIAPLVITQTAGEAAWVTTAKLRLTLDSEKDPLDLTDVAFTSENALEHTLTSLSLATLGRLLNNDKIYVYIALKKDTRTRILKIHEEIAVTGTLAAPTFDVTAPAKIITSTMATFDIVVKQKNVASNDVAWDGVVAVHITPDVRKVVTTATTPFVTAAADGASYKATITLSTLGITTQDKVYVWVRYGMAARANVDTVLPVPVTLAVQAEPDASFTINKPTGIDEEDLAEPIDFEITPTPDDAWDSKAVVATISASKTTPGATPDYTETLTAPVSPSKKWTASFDLSAMDPTTITDFLYVHVKVATGAYDPYVAKIAFTPATPPAFTVTAPTEIKEAEKATPVAFKILPDAGQTWGQSVVKLTISATKATPGATPAFTETITKGTGTTWDGTIDLSTLTVPAGQKVVYAYVKVGDAAYLSDVAEIKYTHAAAPTAKFAIAPAKVTEAPAKADSPEFTITIVKDIDPPAKATKAKVIFKVGEKTLPVEFTPGGTDAAPTWKIEKGECDFTKLEIATFPATGSVEFFPNKDGDAFGPTIPFTFEKKEDPKVDAAMGVSPLVSLLAALVFLFVKLF